MVAHKWQNWINTPSMIAISFFFPISFMERNDRLPKIFCHSASKFWLLICPNMSKIKTIKGCSSLTARVYFSDLSKVPQTILSTWEIFVFKVGNARCSYLYFLILFPTNFNFLGFLRLRSLHFPYYFVSELRMQGESDWSSGACEAWVGSGFVCFQSPVVLICFISFRVFSQILLLISYQQVLSDKKSSIAFSCQSKITS